MFTPLCLDLSKLTSSTDHMDSDALISLHLPPDLTPYEFLFFNHPQILFLTSNLTRHIVLYNLETKSILATYGNEDLNLISNEWIAYLDINCCEGERRIVSMSNKGRMRVLRTGGVNRHIEIIPKYFFRRQNFNFWLTKTIVLKPKKNFQSVMMIGSNHFGWTGGRRIRRRTN